MPVSAILGLVAELDEGLYLPEGGMGRVPRVLSCALAFRTRSRCQDLFENPADYDKVQETDRISVVGLKDLTPGKPVRVIVHHADGKEDTISCRHSFSQEQIAWFKAGAALNLMRG